MTVTDVMCSHRFTEKCSLTDEDLVKGEHIMKYLSSNGREESRTNKGRTGKLTFAYILAAFFLSFGLMFAGSVTSYAEGEGGNNSEENPVNEQTMTDEERAAAEEAARLAAEQAAAEEAARLAAEQAAAEEAARLAAEQAAAEEAARLAAEQTANSTTTLNTTSLTGDQLLGSNTNALGVSLMSTGGQTMGLFSANLGGENEGDGNGDGEPQTPPAPAPKITVTLDSNFSTATVSDGTVIEEGQSVIPTGRLAGYEYTVTKITDTLKQEMISISFHNNSDTAISELKLEDFDLSGIDTNLYDVQYDLDCGIINIVKKSTIHTSGSTSESGSGSGSGSGQTSTETTTVYCDFQEVTTITADQYYYYVPETYDKLGTGSAILGIPQGTAKLNSYESKTTSSSTFGHDNGYVVAELNNNKADSSGSIKNNVNVDEKGKGFDSCKVGLLKQIKGVNGTTIAHQGLMGYWCHYGGAQAYSDGIFGRVYTYKTVTVKLSNITATIKDEALTDLPTGKFTFSDDTVSKYLDVKVKDDNGNSYTVGGCTLIDKTIDFRNGDDTITIDLGGGKTKTIKIDTSGLGKQVWLEDNASVINANKVTASQAQAIQRAISEGIANGEVDNNDPEIIALKDKLAAAIWQENNKDAISANPDDVKNYDLITDTNKNYTNNVPGKVKNYMNVALNANQIRVEARVNEEADKFIKNRLKNADETNPYADATTDNTDKILASKGEYDALAPAVKRFIDGKYTTANESTENAALTYAEIYERALNIKTTADAFVEKYASILVKKDNDQDPDKRETYEKTNTSNYAQIISGANAWKNLTEEERKYINKALNLGNGEAGAEGGVLTNEITFEKLLADAYALRELLNRPAYVAYEDTYDGPEEVYPVFLPKKEVKKEEPVVVETKTEHNTKKHSTENSSSKKTTDDSKLRKENDSALEKIFNNLTKKENEKTDVLAMLEKTVNQIASSITETAKATFGNGAILINVQSWLANTESGEGMWTDSSARNKNLAANQSQVSYTLENADRLAASVLTTSELNYVNNGDTMEIRLRINPNEDKVSKEHKNQFDDAMVAIQDSFVGLTKGEYLDISLEKRRNNGAWQYIPETEDAVRIAIDVPANLVQSGRTFFIIRNHDGECTILRDLDDNDETLTIETDRFSDYLVIYDDNFAESAKNAASGTLYGSAAGTTPTYNNGNTNVVMYVVTFLAILFMVIVVISMRRRDEER